MFGKLLRHGHSAPYIIYPTNPNNVSYWEKYGGLKQLTPKGMQKMFEFGEFIKQNYSTFLTPNYDHRKVYARSASTDRNLQSAYAFLAGLYPPFNETQRWNDKLNWVGSKATLKTEKFIFLHFCLNRNMNYAPNPFN